MQLQILFQKNKEWRRLRSMPVMPFHSLSIVLSYKYTKKFIINKYFTEKYMNFNESRLVRTEAPDHHKDASAFLVFVYEKNGLKVEFKCKDNPDGIFLYYMKILK